MKNIDGQVCEKIRTLISIADAMVSNDEQTILVYPPEQTVNAQMNKKFREIFFHEIF